MFLNICAESQTNSANVIGTFLRFVLEDESLDIPKHDPKVGRVPNHKRKEKASANQMSYYEPSLSLSGKEPTTVEIHPECGLGS